MAISDELWLMGLVLAFTYLIIYKKNRVFGNIIFIATGALTMSNSTSNLIAGGGGL